MISNLRLDTGLLRSQIPKTNTLEVIILVKPDQMVIHNHQIKLVTCFKTCDKHPKNPVGTGGNFEICKTRNNLWFRPPQNRKHNVSKSFIDKVEHVHQS